MMNAHVVQYYQHAATTIEINTASDAWAVWYAMKMFERERLCGRPA